MADGQYFKPDYVLAEPGSLAVVDRCAELSFKNLGVVSINRTTPVPVEFTSTAWNIDGEIPLSVRYDRVSGYFSVLVRRTRASQC